MTAFKHVLSAAAGAALLGLAVPAAADWREDYPTLRLGVITSENEADRLIRYEPVMTYFQETLGVDIEWRTATDYAGIIEGVRAGMIEIARFGPASYARAWMITDGEVEPLVGNLDENGDFGYTSVILVRADSDYEAIEDLEGVTFAFADQNSTSGHQAPRFFLGEEGLDVDTFFGSVSFSGSHENSVIGLLNGTYDAVATFWNSDMSNNPARMAEKGMIEPDSWRVVWQSPRLPSSPWAMSTDLPEDMREDVRAALLAMPEAAPEAWEALTDGNSTGLREVTHADYEAIVRMIDNNLQARRN